jgi:hypothetical protein
MEVELTTEELMDEFKQLKLRQERMEWRVKSIEKELKGRDVNVPTSWTASDATWERWTKDADKDQTA